MKKLIFLAAISAVLAGCGQQKPAETKTPPAQKSPERVAVEKLLDQKYPKDLSPKVFSAAQNAITTEITTFARQKNDPTACDFLGDDRQKSCKNDLYFRDALKASNPRKCAQISDGKFQTVCFDQIKIADALKTGDAKKCDELSTPKQIAKCQSQILSREAQIKKDPKICEQIADQTSAQQCAQMVSLIQNLDAPQK